MNLSSRSFTKKIIGCIGLGKIGFALSKNFSKGGYSVICHDVSESVMEKARNTFGAKTVYKAREVVDQADIVVTALPNDEILKNVMISILPFFRSNQVHVSCSTVSPDTSKKISALHRKTKSYFISAPIFARPDGLTKSQSTIPISGSKEALKEIILLLQTTSTGLFSFGSDPGAANVVKLCGNYLIGCAIQSISESLQLAESNGIDRKEVMKMLNSTIFDCLIYRGYGTRIAERDHYPHPNAHFSLKLGKKDIALVLKTAFSSGVPLPFGSVLYNRFVSSSSKGRDNLDWSAIGLLESEDSGMDLAETISKLKKLKKEDSS
jgi:3-hydroxyisobutyrate dehydrogenase-like beta-hydroxyacid dehydrogenase